jgi:hypothetical protein
LACKGVLSYIHIAGAFVVIKKTAGPEKCVSANASRRSNETL